MCVAEETCGPEGLPPGLMTRQLMPMTAQKTNICMKARHFLSSVLKTYKIHLNCLFCHTLSLDFNYITNYKGLFLKKNCFFSPEMSHKSSAALTYIQLHSFFHIYISYYVMFVLLYKILLLN